MEEEINKFFRICEWDENGKSIETTQDVSESNTSLEAAPVLDEGYSIIKKPLTKKITIQNWEFESDKIDD